MKKYIMLCMVAGITLLAYAQDDSPLHPNTQGWGNLFAEDLSNAEFPGNAWTYADGVLTGTESACIWTKRDYENFILDLEFMTGEGTNSGIILCCTDMQNWLQHAIEIQITDDFAPQWSDGHKTWQCGAIVGHVAPRANVVKKAGEWNHFTITCSDGSMKVVLNDVLISEMDMDEWKSIKVNPDGTEMANAPLTVPATIGRIGLQGKYAGLPIHFRNMKVLELR